MITMLMRRLAAGTLCFAAVAAGPTMTLAQSDPVSNFFGIQPQTYADVPNVPDAEGCVKSCFRDYSPCDPPSFKHADNRCGMITRRH